MKPDINQIQDQISAEFELFDQWTDKYEYIIDLGKKLPLIAEQFKCDANLVPGCQSRVWLHAEIDSEHDDKTDAKIDGGRVLFTADSDAIITKGIIALLIRVLSDQPAEHIRNCDLYFIDNIGLKEHLSPTRSNGLVNMVARIKAHAANLC